jgi:hypothetical protein
MELSLTDTHVVMSMIGLSLLIVMKKKIDCRNEPFNFHNNLTRPGSNTNATNNLITLISTMVLPFYFYPIIPVGISTTIKY